ncbi:AcrR family transcriptional regulator [Kibdelosporangium banguiense]|uniref:AcrR family transcriptional regulator n=1 Tax=Kibdelosporangium banguiense TaxID=1365924 RepID=A0ABS4TQG4_9PSEU|nr:TetR/AcrR family transcriptional regulator [Kibdelosporangium banguiense]MBP2326180.1 AcrR family transcriptional regulator [Kibdelosporangium banguiense]
MREHSGGGDPARSLALLWRKQNPRPVRNGKQNLSVDRIMLAAIEVADADGLGSLSMRRVAEKLGVGTMSLYTYIPGKGELIDLMLDTVYGETDKPEHAPGTPWRTKLEQVARENWALYHRHPWILQAGVSRPPLGPNVTAKYEYELHAIDGIGLTHIEMDTALNLVIGHAETAARRDIDASATEKDSGMTDDQWWQANEPLLSKLADYTEFPLASAVGQAVGSTYGTAYDATHNFEFGLQRILDGIEVLVSSR